MVGHRAGRPSQALSSGVAVLTWAKSVPEISMPLVGTVAPWQFTFITVGLPGILVALLMLTIREPKRQRTIGTEIAPKFSVMLKHVGSRWRVYLNFVSFVCLMTIIAYSQGWYAAMFKRTWGWEAETYATVNAIVLLAVGPLTVNVAGWLNDKFYSKGRKDAPLLIMIAGACLMVPTGIIAPLVPSPILAMVILAFNTLGIAMTSATGVTGLMNITPGEIRGQTVALYYMMISLSGLLLGPGTVGWLSDNVFGNEHLNYAAATVPAIFGIPVLFLIGYARRAYVAEVERQEAAGSS